MKRFRCRANVRTLNLRYCPPHPFNSTIAPASTTQLSKSIIPSAQLRDCAIMPSSTAPASGSDKAKVHKLQIKGSAKVRIPLPWNGEWLAC